MREDDGKPPSKAEQAAEAAARAKDRVAQLQQSDGKKVNASQQQEHVPEPEADLASPEADGGDRSQPRGKPPAIDPDAEKAPVMGKSRRDDIVKRFREQRAAQEQESDEDLKAFNQEGMPAEFTDQISHEPVIEPDDDEPVKVAAQQDEPEPEGEPVYVIKVRGKEIEVTEAQLEQLAAKVDGPGTVVDKAQKALAGDDYLREARDVLAEAKRLREDVLAQRASPAAIHPGDQKSTQTAEQADTTGDIAHPDDPFAKAVEAIQFGQPEEAARILREAVTTTTATQAKGVSEDAITDQQMRREADRANRIGKAFEAAHPDLAKDEFSREAIINRCVRLQHEDLLKLAAEIRIDPATVPKDAATIQHWHRFYRAKSFNVRDPEVLLNQAKDDFVAWRGGEKQPAVPEVTRAQPRVEITLERRTRRAAIPQQPSRTVSPKPDQRQQQAPVRQDRSDIVQQMIASRKAPRQSPKTVSRA